MNPYLQTKREGKKVNEHRAKYAEFLGRPLGRFEFVHHINGNKRDNRLENLELVSPAIHAVRHGRQKYPLTKLCVVCKKKFTPDPTKRKRALTCSPRCRWIRVSLANRRPNNPRSMYRVDAYPSQIKNRMKISSCKLRQNLL